MIPAATECIDHITGGSIEYVKYGASSERYIRESTLITENEMEELRKMDAILFGAIGDPRVKPGIMERGVILRLRRELGLFLNLRPARSLPFSKFDMNIAIARENTEEFYMGFGGKIDEGGSKFLHRSNAWSGELEVSGSSDDDLYFNLGVMSRKNLERFFRKALSFKQANEGKGVTVVDKANAVTGLYEIWREVAGEELAKAGIKPHFMYGDAVAYDLVMDPSKFGLIMASNLYGDILSDLCAGMIGGLGFAPSGSYGLGKVALFEPVHGSAPDIAGRGIANPIGAILSGAMMLDHLGMKEKGQALEEAVGLAVQDGVMTHDIGGSDGTKRVVASVVKHLP